AVAAGFGVVACSAGPDLPDETAFFAVSVTAVVGLDAAFAGAVEFFTVSGATVFGLGVSASFFAVSGADVAGFVASFVVAFFDGSVATCVERAITGVSVTGVVAAALIAGRVLLGCGPGALGLTAAASGAVCAADGLASSESGSARPAVSRRDAASAAAFCPFTNAMFARCCSYVGAKMCRPWPFATK